MIGRRRTTVSRSGAEVRNARRPTARRTRGTTPRQAWAVRLLIERSYPRVPPPAQVCWGAASGLGEATARELARLGAKVAVLDVVFEGSTAQGKDDGFDADVAIATSELAALIPDVLDALDGEVVEG